MELASWIQPGVVIAFLVFVWRDLKQDMRTLSERLDRHLEGHS